MGSVQASTGNNSKLQFWVKFVAALCSSGTDMKLIPHREIGTPYNLQSMKAERFLKSKAES